MHIEISYSGKSDQIVTQIKFFKMQKTVCIGKIDIFNAIILQFKAVQGFEGREFSYIFYAIFAEVKLGKVFEICQVTLHTVNNVSIFCKFQLQKNAFKILYSRV